MISTILVNLKIESALKTYLFVIWFYTNQGGQNLAKVECFGIIFLISYIERRHNTLPKKVSCVKKME